MGGEGDAQKAEIDRWRWNSNAEEVIAEKLRADLRNCQTENDRLQKQLNEMENELDELTNVNDSIKNEIDKLKKAIVTIEANFLIC